MVSFFETTKSSFNPVFFFSLEWCGDNWEGMNKTPKEEFQLDYEDIEFEGPENSTLRGWYIPVKGIPTKNAGVIGVHG